MQTAAKITKVVVDFGLVCLVVVALVYTLGALGAALDGPSAHDEAVDVAAEAAAREQESADLHAALARHQQENPAGWTPEQIARGDVAATVAAQHTGARP